MFKLAYKLLATFDVKSHTAWLHWREEVFQHDCLRQAQGIPSIFE